MPVFSTDDYWKALILYGLNQATYKIALGKTLLSLSSKGLTKVPWEELSSEFFQQYRKRLSGQRMPQQANPSRQTVMERIVTSFEMGKSLDESVAAVGSEAFDDVIPRFHHLAGMEELHGKFYRFVAGRHIELTDALHSIRESKGAELEEELDARWSLLEGAFSIRAGDFALANDIRAIYLAAGYERKPLTDNIPFLQGYQGNTCFYCGETLHGADVDVDHVLPRQVLHHDEIWNLVLAHRLCNGQKLDKLVGPHFLKKLMARNENIMGSNHPWKKKIAAALGSTPQERASKLRWHYRNVEAVIGRNYWGGSKHYDPSMDQFYKRLITVINNGIV